MENFQFYEYVCVSIPYEYPHMNRFCMNRKIKFPNCCLPEWQILVSSPSVRIEFNSSENMKKKPFNMKIMNDRFLNER